MTIRLWISATVLLGVMSPAMADSMRCGNKLVVSGDTKLEVLQKCGEPDFMETIKLVKKSREVNLSSPQTGTDLTHRHSRSSSSGHTEQSGITLGSETVEAIEQWSYNRGPTQFIKLLTFRGGRLESVEAAQRGFSE